MRKDKNKSEKVHGRMRAFGNNNERSGRRSGTGKEKLLSAKVKISYEKPEELKQIVAMLSPVMRSCKVAKGQQGRYKKAYVEIEGLADKMPQESE